jgi:glycosyltransferase involved in cell wall biosynthesis
VLNPVLKPVTIHLVVPERIDDPARPSGGNVYGRRIATELAALGRPVREITALADLEALPDESVVLVDGLVASAEPNRVVRAADRLHVVVLVHMPWGLGAPDHRGPEAAMLRSVAGVVTTSAWTRDWLVQEYAVPATRITVAVPGADRSGLATGTPAGGALLCVGAVTPTKGHDLLLEAVSTLRGPWQLTCVGSLDVDPGFAHAIRERATVLEQVVLTGPLVGDHLDAAYRAADVLVVPSRAETYGMVITEALAHGLPVVASETGGTPEAVGRAAGGEVPGLLVPPGDAPALARALQTWLDEPGLRDRARLAARDRRDTLPTWTDAGVRIAAALT